MREKIITGLTDWSDVDTSQRELFQYYYGMLLDKIESICLFLLVAVIMHKVVDVFVYLVTFCTIRRYTGGYHASSPNVCLICSVVLVCLSVGALAPWLHLHPVLAIILVLVSDLVFVTYAPVNHPNLALDVHEYRCLRCRVLGLVALHIMIFPVLVFLQWIIYSTVAIGITSAAVLVVAAKLFKQEVRLNEKCFIKSESDT